MLTTDISENLTQNEVKSKILDPLNKVQRQAVEHTDGPLLIIAGAGSGKTRVITHRIAYLIYNKLISPWNIAAITFTNKAAEEMRVRLKSLIGSMMPSVFVRTFHSLGLYILSRHPEALGLKAGFSIVDQKGQKHLIKTILKEEGFDQNYLDPSSVANQINKARDAMMGPKTMLKSEIGYAEDISLIYEIYIQRLRKSNSVDFSDLLYESVQLLKNDEELHGYYAQLWKHIMIDEYQDTNFAQYQLGHLLAQKHENIVVVGDDDQSIYSWRGANIKNILDFEKDYSKATVLKLEENYRSTSVILNAASSLIAKNNQRREKTLFTTNNKSEAPPIYYQSYDDEAHEAANVVQQIIYYKNTKDIPLTDMAIFYRTNAQSRIFERLLRENNLAYLIVGDIRFYERKEIKDILAYLSVIVNPDDDLSLERILNVPARGVGATSMKHLKNLAKTQNITLLASISKAETIPKFRKHEKMKKLHQLFNTCHNLSLAKVKPSEITEKLIQESGYLAALKDDTSLDATGRIENVYEFITSLKEYEAECAKNIKSPYANNYIDPFKYSREDEAEEIQASLSDYLQRVSLYTDKKDDEESDNICLMTLHNAKGLEFKCVFLCGVEEDYIPHSLSIAEGNLEEERRLLYVGITRAKQYLHLSYASRRSIFGILKPRMQSQFIAEIDKNVFQYPEAVNSNNSLAEARPSYYYGNNQTRENSFIQNKVQNKVENKESYANGERVYHKRYGKGEVQKVEAMPIGQKLTIKFEAEKETKLFLSQYTPLTKLSE